METKTVTIRRKALAASEEQAAKLRERFAESGTLVLNLISSPGSGKTTLLETTVGRLADDYRLAVIEGDVATERDADRIRAMGVPAHQVLTSGACHLDARQIETALEATDLLPAEILVIENVGNLICPTTYDLGEDFKVALLSVTEGDDKPIKYPAIFSRADVTVITKSDLLPYVPFDLETTKQHIASLNPNGVILVVSSISGDGIDGWCDLIVRRLEAKRRS
ncbi:MAG: hydrogenase nickel incorporation protein HypB [Thermoanaerobaculales bacterium]|jgi:hydrogenase nickel incorporation protein HypB|nr:hydrogenase nickel incorporation protein HypB [Thermoanaerobaculales bacterium]